MLQFQFSFLQAKLAEQYSWRTAIDIKRDNNLLQRGHSNTLKVRSFVQLFVQTMHWLINSFAYNTTFCREDTQGLFISIHLFIIHSFNHLHTQGSIICSKPFSHSFLYNTTQTQSSFVHLFSYLSIFPFIHSFIHSFSYDISQHSK